MIYCGCMLRFWNRWGMICLAVLSLFYFIIPVATRAGDGCYIAAKQTDSVSVNLLESKTGVLQDAWSCQSLRDITIDKATVAKYCVPSGSCPKDYHCCIPDARKYATDPTSCASGSSSNSLKVVLNNNAGTNAFELQCVTVNDLKASDDIVSSYCTGASNCGGDYRLRAIRFRLFWISNQKNRSKDRLRVALLWQ